MLLICPSCRVVTPDRIDLSTLTPLDPGLLRCDNEACGATFPMVHGIAIVGVNLAAWLATEALPLLAGPWPTALLAQLAKSGDDAQPIARWLEHLGLYLDAHYGDRARPPAADVFGFGPLAAKIAERAAHPVDCAVELGCSVGRGLFELGRGAKRVYGIDRNAAALRAAATLLSGQGVPYARRVIGREYAEAEAQPPGPAPAAVQLVAGDLLDPPLPPRSVQRVVAMNVLDSVTQPRQLLAVIDGLLEPGGEALLCSPYAWTSGYTDEEARLLGPTPDAVVRTIFTMGEGLTATYTVEDEAELPWVLRRDARLSHHYRVHYVRVTKTERPGSRA